MLWTFAVITLAGCALSARAQEQVVPNPILWADVPDVAIIRVGDTYYMSSTTMHMSPGLPIMKSTDLVNWTLIGYAYDRLAENDALSLLNGRNAYGAGSWASSLRYQDGTFFVSTFSSSTGKTHIFTTTDIEKGGWRESSFSPSLHDHSLLFDDDGRVYMVYGAGQIKLIELTSDASRIKPGAPEHVIIENASLVAGPNVGLPAEGSQIRKIDGRYYLFNITWPRGDMRTQIVHRADRITGPYEGRVFLRNQGVAQGCLIDTPTGEWFAMLFQDHGAVGRTPFLLAVKWENGWPVPVDAGALSTGMSVVARGLGNLVASDEFDRPAEVLAALRAARPDEGNSVRNALPLAWQWNHNPDPRHWSLTARPGWLRLTAGSVAADLAAARNTLTQRTFGPCSSAVTCVDASRMRDGDVAGLTAFQKNYGFVGIRKTGTARALIVVTHEADGPRELSIADLDQASVFLKVDCDFRHNVDLARFSYSLDGSTWLPAGKPLAMRYTLPHFMGYRFGLFNFATKSPGGFVDFDFFRVSDRFSQP